MSNSDGFADSPFGELSDNESAQLAELYVAMPELRTVDPAEVSKRMGDRVLGAGSLDELFDALSGNTSDALIGRSFQFNDVIFQPYKATRGIIPAAVCDVTDLSTGEASEFWTSGDMVVKFLYRAKTLGAFPFKARLVGKKTNSGQTALNFERV